MSTLRAYVGSRDTATKSSGRADQPRSQAAPSDDRVQAKLLEMGFSNVQDQINTTSEAQNMSKSNRQTVGDQHRIALTRTKLQRDFSVSSSTNNRWPGYRSTPASPPSAKDENEFERGLLRDPTNRRDPFDTDTENLDSTITLSDFGDVQAFQAQSLPSKTASNGVDPIHVSEYFHGDSVLSVAEQRQRQPDHSLNAQENNVLTMNKREYAIDNGLDEINGEDVPDQEDHIGDGLSSQGFAEELNNGEYIHHSNEPSNIQAANAGSFMKSPTVYKQLVMRNPDERSPDTASPLSHVPWLDPGHTIDARRRIAGTPYSFPKHDTSRPKDLRPKSSAGTSKPLEPDMPKEKRIPHSSRQGYQHNSRQLSHDADDAAFETHSRKRGIGMDYNPTQLHEMTYERLRHESFDPIKPVQGEAHQRLSDKLQDVYDLKGSKDPHLKRRTFFSDLTIEQYEECGGLMVERFTDMMTRYKIARQQKRSVAKEFEEEIAQREERVRAKSHVVDQDLGRLRKAGEDVVRGKGV